MLFTSIGIIYNLINNFLVLPHTSTQDSDNSKIHKINYCPLMQIYLQKFKYQFK